MKCNTKSRIVFFNTVTVRDSYMSISFKQSSQITTKFISKFKRIFIFLILIYTFIKCKLRVIAFYLKIIYTIIIQLIYNIISFVFYFIYYFKINNQFI